TFNTRTDEVMSATAQAINEGKLTVAQAHKLLEDPSIPAMLAELLDTSRNIKEATGEFREAARHAPTIAASVDKIAHESSRFARITLIANILGTLGRAFLP